MSLKRKRSLGDVVQSAMVKFIIGEAGVECNVHEAVIANLSEPFQAFLTSKRQESTEGSVVWKDLEMQTFAAFVEYVYTQDFTIEDPDEMSDHHESTLLGFLSKGKKCAAMGYAKSYHDVKNDMRKAIRHSHEYYMSIARLYDLANRYDLSELVDCCIEKVRIGLANTSFEDVEALTTWALLEFIWPKTNIGDKFREVLLRVILIDLRTAMESEEAAHVLENTPEISTALLLMAPHSFWQELTSYY
ncbi:hypothetical protein CTA2_3580 [Colletotrichum tanaceti]|uniref:BTB domain-containing protein n=1 Tax=Colletotrichum tanaceti TaxID=1306861 RepID=A0A4U6XJI5_9PEZI|nr:hypothetical protein CTA2_3580 [Colletotrichum tanaceti]TKW56160.1 hypothetical protein CTA1_2987 [Colletotrichum tanaceti]